jgi:DNA-binding transcriptional LysR family regulator
MSDATALDALTLDQLRVFLAVVDAGSFTSASKKLRRAQSAVSYAIANLEKQLGVVLFDRASRTPKLTPAALALAAEARGVVTRVDHLRGLARQIAGGVEPSVSFAVDVLFPLDGLVASLSEFEQRFPTVALDLHTEVLGGVTQLVADGTCSFGIAGPLPKWPDRVVHRPITQLPMAWAAAPEHPLARVRGAIPADVAREHTQIVLTDRSRLTDGYDLGIVAARVWRVASLGAKHELLRAGLGWGGMPLHAIEEDLAKKKLVRLRLAGRESERHEAPLFLVYRPAEPPGPAAQWLVERLGKRCEGKGG